jgi:hypothetical protein
MAVARCITTDSSRITSTSDDTRCDEATCDGKTGYCRQRGERSITWHPMVAGIPKFWGRVFFRDCMSMSYCMEQSHFWEANRFLASQEIPRTLWKPKVRYRVYKSPPPVPILSQVSPLLGPPFRIYTCMYLFTHMSVLSVLSCPSFLFYLPYISSSFSVPFLPKLSY